MPTNHPHQSTLSGRAKKFPRCLAIGIAALMLAGCVYEPYPEPAPAPVVAAPPVAYYGQPCCYAYNQYPPYYYGPNVSVAFGHRGGWYRHW